MKNRRGGWRYPAWSRGAIWLVAFCLPALALGQGVAPLFVGQTTTFEKPGRPKYSAESSLRLTFDVSRLQSEVTGYTPLLIEVESQTPLATDTRLRLSFSTSRTSERAEFTVGQEWTLPAGSSRNTLRLQIPSYGVGQFSWWDVWVDEIHDEKLSQESEQPAVLPTLMGTVPADVTPLRLLDTNYRNNKNFNWRGVLNATLAGGNSGSMRSPQDIPLAENVLAIFIPEDLPDRWEDLLPLDIVRIEMSQLVRVQQERPEAFRALVRWVHGGGNLWVDRMGSDWEKLPQLTGLLGWPDREPQTEPRIPGEEQPPGVGAWDALDLAARAVSYNEDGLPVGADGNPVPAEQMQELLGIAGGKDPAEEIPPFYSDDWMAVRQLGWGTVAAFRQDWFATPGRMKNSHKEAAVGYWLQRSWYERHGTNPRLPNSDFSSWLVPGVGSAPVLEFQFLITLFVIVIGPLNYWLLNRVGRRHLLVVTIPLVATLVTVALLGYGLLADGWTTRVRAMSVTYIDRHQEIASSWSRLSYYAAFAPRDGLEFSRDAQVYPIKPGAYEAFADPSRLHSLTLNWNDEGQQLERGWLNSRTPTQLLAIESRREAKGLKIGRGDQGLAAESPFTAPLEWVAAIDDEGQWYQAKNITQRGRFPLKEATEAEVVTAFRRLVQDRQPSVPAELLDVPLSYRADRRRYGYWSRHSTVSIEISLLARHWALLNGQKTYPALRLPERSYIVVGDNALMTSLGLDDAEESGSVHVVLGDW